MQLIFLKSTNNSHRYNLSFNSKIRVDSIELLINGISVNDNLSHINEHIDAYFSINRKESDRPFFVHAGKSYPKPKK